MAAELSPIQAAEIASSAYALRLSTDLLDAEVTIPSARSFFSVRDGVRLTGTTGAGIYETNGFGYVAWGRSSRQGECVVSVRGTFKTSPYDWLSNLRMGASIGPSGYPVHTGFLRAAQSVLPQILKEVNSVGRSPATIHVVGHSLGGAMATLLADSLKNIGGVKLYTFGAPRSGLHRHAQYLTGQLGAENIFRSYHNTDPVPMVPVFPYQHVPEGSVAHLMPGPGHLVSISAHDMSEYRKSVGGANWDSLPKMPKALSSFESADQWLAQTAASSSGTIMMSASALRLILQALGWILKKMGQLAGTEVLIGATILDQFAQLLYTGALQSIKLAGIINNLMISAMRFLGRTVVAGTSLTVDFIEFVLGMLFRVVSTAAKRAIDTFS